MIKWVIQQQLCLISILIAGLFGSGARCTSLCFLESAALQRKMTTTCSLGLGFSPDHVRSETRWLLQRIPLQAALVLVPAGNLDLQNYFLELYEVRIWVVFYK